jgi:hypothetical protein
MFMYVVTYTQRDGYYQDQYCRLNEFFKLHLFGTFGEKTWG